MQILCVPRAHAKEIGFESRCEFVDEEDKRCTGNTIGGIHGNRSRKDSLAECEVDGCTTTPIGGIHGLSCFKDSLAECGVDERESLVLYN